MAKSDEFVDADRQIAVASSRPRPPTSRRSRPSSLDDRSVAELIEDLAVAIGEKLEIGRFAYFDGAPRLLHAPRAPTCPPAVGVLVEYAGDERGRARGVAMQIAAMRPKYLTRDEVPAEVVETERAIAEATAREEGKPEQAMPKIIEGRVNGFFKDFVLLEQPSVRTKEDRQGGPRRGRDHGHPVRAVRGRRLT